MDTETDCFLFSTAYWEQEYEKIQIKKKEKNQESKKQIVIDKTIIDKTIQELGKEKTKLEKIINELKRI